MVDLDRRPGCTPRVVDPDAPPRAWSVYDADYDPAIGGLVRVHLDGQPVSHCIGYDIDRGLVVAHRLSNLGLPVLNAQRTATVIDRRKGTVTADWAGAAPPATLRRRLAPPGD